MCAPAHTVRIRAGADITYMSLVTSRICLFSRHIYDFFHVTYISLFTYTCLLLRTRIQVSFAGLFSRTYVSFDITCTAPGRCQHKHSFGAHAPAHLCAQRPSFVYFAPRRSWCVHTSLLHFSLHVRRSLLEVCFHVYTSLLTCTTKIIPAFCSSSQQVRMYFFLVRLFERLQVSSVGLFSCM